jgi:hypothetical protein
MGILCALLLVLIGIFVGLALGAMMLQACCFLAGAPVPGFSEAMVVVLVNMLANGVVGFVTTFLIVTAMKKDVQTAQIVAAAVNIPIGMVISVFIYSVMLQGVTAGRAFLIWFVQAVIGFCLLFFIWLLARQLPYKGKRASFAVPGLVARSECYLFSSNAYNLLAVRT